MGWPFRRPDPCPGGSPLIFLPTEVEGVLCVEPDRREDERGYFARTFCEHEFAAQGRPFRPVQCSTSFNVRRRTLRGLHFQAEPHGEDKLVRCTRGEIFDVAVDLRRDSQSFLRVATAVLSPENGRQLFIPRGCAHGFITLVDNTEVEYMISAVFVPEAASGLRWNDPMLSISWPMQPEVISDRDQSWPLLP